MGEQQKSTEHKTSVQGQVRQLFMFAGLIVIAAATTAIIVGLLISQGG